MSSAWSSIWPSITIIHTAKWWIANDGNEKRGDRCGGCGEPIVEGQRFLAWRIAIAAATPTEVWVFLHELCAVQLVFQSPNATLARIEDIKRGLKDGEDIWSL